MSTGPHQRLGAATSIAIERFGMIGDLLIFLIGSLGITLWALLALAVDEARRRAAPRHNAERG